MVDEPPRKPTFQRRIAFPLFRKHFFFKASLSSTLGLPAGLFLFLGIMDLPPREMTFFGAPFFPDKATVKPRPHRSVAAYFIFFIVRFGRSSRDVIGSPPSQSRKSPSQYLLFKKGISLLAPTPRTPASCLCEALFFQLIQYLFFPDFSELGFLCSFPNAPISSAHCFPPFLSSRFSMTSNLPPELPFPLSERKLAVELDFSLFQEFFSSLLIPSFRTVVNPFEILLSL